MSADAPYAGTTPSPTTTPPPPLTGAVPTTTPQVTERRAHSISGWPVVVLGAAGIIGCTWAFGHAIAIAGEGFDLPLYAWASLVGLTLIIILLAGLTPVARARHAWCSCSAATSARSARTGCAG